MPFLQWPELIYISYRGGIFMKRIKTIILGLTLISSLTGIIGCSSNRVENEKVTVTDMIGERVTINKNPKKVACISRTTYDLLIAYGLGDNIDGVYSKILKNPWTEVFYPASKDHFAYDYSPNYETLLARGIDLVLSPEKYITDGLREHGINALTVSLYGNPTFDNYVSFFSNLVTQIWDNKKVKDKAERWNNKTTSAIKEIKDELAKHDIAKRKLFYVRGDKDYGIGYTDVSSSFSEYAYRTLGFENYSSTVTGGGEKPSAEAICEYNPDVFVMGGIYANKHVLDIKTTDPYTTLEAVKNNKIYTIPSGLTAMEQLNALTPIFFYDQANKLYPEYFNYDVKSMIKESTKEYFNTDLTDQQVEYMLNCLGPTGEELY